MLDKKIIPLTQMSRARRQEGFAEPEIGSVIDVLRLASIGHAPRKTAVVNSAFSFEGFGLVLRGRGFYQAGQRRRRELVAPAVFYIWPGEVFHYGPDAGTSWEERYLCFTGARVADWVRWRWLAHPEEPVPLGAADSLAQQHRRIAQASTEGRSIEQAKLETEQLVYALHREARPPADEEDDLSRLIARWMAAPETAVNMKAAAASLDMSAGSFRQHFVKRTGLPPYQFLLRLRIDRASGRLLETADPVKTIAYECGFGFAESFDRAFRQLKGVTPTEYRRQMTLLRGKA
jgi:AraC-like DNA-binding protein